MLYGEGVAYAVLGLLAAYAGGRIFSARLQFGPLLLATGPVAGLVGGLVTHTIVGGGHPEATLPAAFGTAAALLSLLARPPARGRHSKVRASNA
ncbi:hypothetical protein VSR01_26320 [Actinacidiphila sp. DG2A-62]|jgi:hypothetical protein|uniref:hypothetical protein n=1 Tax=Actinacidiphila sp. DG2A-62 TaxID=3108821 RepID=UPI002DBEBEA7|nr:hypothetical protein [Actinacidiphila sp. DG2A-62]MEC3996834.1 hypothetical protein [Actinacidiphila sp. DG2A-62]